VTFSISIFEAGTGGTKEEVDTLAREGFIRDVEGMEAE
jgi:hypothetical protein